MNSPDSSPPVGGHSQLTANCRPLQIPTPLLYVFFSSHDARPGAARIRTAGVVLLHAGGTIECSLCRSVVDVESGAPRFSSGVISVGFGRSSALRKSKWHRTRKLTSKLSFGKCIVCFSKLSHAWRWMAATICFSR